MVADHPPAPPAPHAAADHSPTPPAPLVAHVAAARAAFSPAEDALLADTLAVYGRLTKEAVAAFAIAAAARGFPVRSKSQLYTRCNGKKGPQPQFQLAKEDYRGRVTGEVPKLEDLLFG